MPAARRCPAACRRPTRSQPLPCRVGLVTRSVAPAAPARLCTAASFYPSLPYHTATAGAPSAWLLPPSAGAPSTVQPLDKKSCPGPYTFYRMCFVCCQGLIVVICGWGPGSTNSTRSAPHAVTGGRCRPQRPWGSSSLPPYQKFYMSCAAFSRLPAFLFYTGFLTMLHNTPSRQQCQDMQHNSMSAKP